MPVTFLPSDPHSLVGPGLPFQVSTDSTSWSSPPATWEIQVYGGTGFANQFWTESWPYVSTVQNEVMGLGTLQPNVVAPTYYASTDDTVKIGVFLRDSAGDDLEDTVQSGLTWDNQTGLPILIKNQTGSGGLTVTQADQLENASTNSDTALSNWATYTSVTLPSLNDVLTTIITDVTAVFGTGTEAVQKTIGQLLSWIPTSTFGLFNVTGGETCDPIDFGAGGAAYWGAILTATTIPDWWTFTAPDDDYSPQALADFWITRGGVSIFRIGLHSRQTTVYPLPQAFPFQIADVGIPILPEGYEFHVRWGPGVCGTLELMYEP